MKIIINSDEHCVANLSAIRGKGKEFSVRLEHFIDSVNWVNDLAIKEGCSIVLCAGDFFDKTKITDEEATALTKINWNGLRWYLLCGNHESSVSDLRYNMLKLLETDERIVVSEVQVLNLDYVDLLFLPYIVESNRKDLSEYIESVKEQLTGKPIVILSHNDICGIDYGSNVSKTGFSIDEIEQNCALFLNGHLHNTTKVTDRIINVGSLFAHNFSCDSSIYSYGAWILDTETLNIKFYENPYGFNFYTFDIRSESDFKKLSKIKPNAAVKIKCSENLVPALKDELEKYKDRILSQNIIQVLTSTGTETANVDTSYKFDYLEKLAELCRATITNSDMLEEELAIICK